MLVQAENILRRPIHAIRGGFDNRKAQKDFEQRNRRIFEESGVTGWMENKKEELTAKGKKPKVYPDGTEIVFTADPQQVRVQNELATKLRKVKAQIDFDGSIDVSYSAGDGWASLRLYHWDNPEKFQTPLKDMSVPEQLDKAFELAHYEFEGINRRPLRYGLLKWG